MRGFPKSGLAAVLLGLTTLASALSAPQGWPTRPVTMVVPFAAGGGNDVLARIFAAALSKELGQQVVIDNMGGAGGRNAALRIAKASPDGYQFILGNVANFAYSQTLVKAPPYDAIADFTPVALIADVPLILIVRKSLPVHTLQEFTTYVRASHAKMRFGSAGSGSATHLGCVLLNSVIGTSVTHIPYRGGGPALQDLLADRIDYLCLTSTIAFRQINAGQVRGIANLAHKRSRGLPSLPTADEQGMSGFDASTWNAFFLPKATPSPIVRKLHTATIAAMEIESVQKQFEKIGVDIVAPARRSSDYLMKFLPSEIKKWADPIRAAGLMQN